MSYVIAVGINGTSDDSAAVAASHGAVVGHAAKIGYGHGCMAAIEALHKAGISPTAFVFCAADGAHDCEDVLRLVKCHRDGVNFVLGQRTFILSNWMQGAWRRRVQNLILGGVASLFSQRLFSDLGPLRLIQADLFAAMALRELEYGWTIEAQVRAVQLGAKIKRLQVREYDRTVGEQKISGVSWSHSLGIAWHIVSAGWRTLLRHSKQLHSSATPAATPSKGMTNEASSQASLVELS